MAAPLPFNEAARLEALRQCQMLDTDAEAVFDDITRLAAHICGVPIAAVSLIDENRQWFKSIFGLPVRETGRDAAFCAHTILQPGTMSVQDAQTDVRFADNPLVTGDPHIRFYAGAPLITSDGFALGSLCVIDRVPRQLTADQEAALSLLARQAVSQLEMTRRLAEQAQLIAERAAAEMECRRLAAIVETSADAIISTDLDGSILSWNRGAEHLYGYTAAEMIGKPQATLVPPGETTFHAALIDQIMQSERIEDLEVVRQTMSGLPINVSLTLSLIRDASGEPVGVSAIGRDITERIRIEAALEAERQFQQALLESLQEGIVACDGTGRLSLFNNASREFHGLPAQPLPAEQWAEHFDLYQPDGQTRMETSDVPLFRALQGETVRDAEMVIAPKSGPVRTLVASGQAITDSQGNKLGAVVAMHDVTERVRAERALRQSEARLNDAQRMAHIGNWEYDIASGRILWSEELFRLFDIDPAGGEPSLEELMTYYHPDDVEMHETIVSRAVENGKPYEFDIRILRRSGEIRWVHAVGSGEYDDTGRVFRLVGTVMDIHARKTTEEALRESKQFVESIADNSASIIFVFDLDTLSNVYSNRSVGEFLGYPVEQVQAMGSDILSQILHSDDLQDVQAHFSEFVNKADGDVIELEYRVRHASGEWRWMWSREVIFKRHADGRPCQIMGMAHDITERKQAQEENARLAAIVESSNDAILGSTLDGTLVSWNAAAVRLFGYTEAEIMGQHASALVPPAKRGFMKGVTQAVLRGERHEFVDTECRRKDGSGVWVSLTFSPIKSASGEITGIAAIARDISAQKQAEADLRRSEEALRTIMESSPIVLYATDADGIVTLSEGAGLERLGLKPGQVVGQSVFEMYKDAPEIANNLRRALEGETVSYDAQLHNLCYHNEIRPRLNTEGAIIGMVGVGHDITDRHLAEQSLKDFSVVLEFQKQELEKMNAELEALATIDGLTGLRNRRAFDERLAEEFERATRYQKPLSLLLLDVDSFKQYNDTFGHLAGDDVLRRIGRVLFSATREMDYLARYGGEEIAVILPETDGSGALQVAERIRFAIANEDWDHRAVTASLGVCALQLNMERPMDMVSCADRELYQSKAKGRNCVTYVGITHFGQSQTPAAHVSYTQERRTGDISLPIE